MVERRVRVRGRGSVGGRVRVRVRVRVTGRVIRVLGREARQLVPANKGARDTSVNILNPIQNIGCMTQVKSFKIDLRTRAASYHTNAMPLCPYHRPSYWCSVLSYNTMPLCPYHRPSYPCSVLSY